MGKMSRNKGAEGEREIKNLHNVFLRKLGYSIEMKRNSFQSLEGGYDLVGLPFLAIEIKRQEQLALNDWWKQTVEQAKDGQSPVLFYRQSYQPWRVRMMGSPSGNLIMAMQIPMVIDISIDDYFLWLREMLYRYAQGGQDV